MSIRWAYAVNQWKPNIDDFVRRRDHERALKTISISGFEAVELNVASFGPWEPLGNPFQIANHFGTAAGFRGFLRDCALTGASSWFYDPGFGFVEADGGRDYFFHLTDLDESLPFDETEEGQAVAFEVKRQADAYRAGAATRIRLREPEAATTE